MSQGELKHILTYNGVNYKNKVVNIQTIIHKIKGKNDDGYKIRILYYVDSNGNLKTVTNKVLNIYNEFIHELDESGYDSSESEESKSSSN